MKDHEYSSVFFPGGDRKLCVVDMGHDEVCFQVWENGRLADGITIDITSVHRLMNDLAHIVAREQWL